MQASTEQWLQAHTKQEQLARAHSVDFGVAFAHAFPQGELKRLDRLTLLHRASQHTQEYLQLFATLYQRIKDRKLRSRCAPLLFTDAKGEQLLPSMTARLQDNALAAAESKLLAAEVRLGLAVHADIQCEGARTELVKAKIAACGQVPELQLCAAKNAVAIDEQLVATQSLVHHLVAYAQWGRAAGICKWFPTRFVTTGLPDWMAEVIADNASIHKQEVIECKSWDAVLESINTEASEVPYVPIATGKSPVLENAFVYF